MLNIDLLRTGIQNSNEPLYDDSGDLTKLDAPKSSRIHSQLKFLVAACAISASYFFSNQEFSKHLKTAAQSKDLPNTALNNKELELKLKSQIEQLLDSEALDLTQLSDFCDLTAEFKKQIAITGYPRIHFISQIDLDRELARIYSEPVRRCFEDFRNAYEERQEISLVSIDRVSKVNYLKPQWPFKELHKLTSLIVSIKQNLEVPERSFYFKSLISDNDNDNMPSIATYSNITPRLIDIGTLLAKDLERTVAQSLDSKFPVTGMDLIVEPQNFRAAPLFIEASLREAIINDASFLKEMLQIYDQLKIPNDKFQSMLNDSFARIVLQVWSSLEEQSNKQNTESNRPLVNLSKVLSWLEKLGSEMGATQTTRFDIVKVIGFDRAINLVNKHSNDLNWQHGKLTWQKPDSVSNNQDSEDKLILKLEKQIEQLKKLYKQLDLYRT